MLYTTFIPLLFYFGDMTPSSSLVSKKKKKIQGLIGSATSAKRDKNMTKVRCIALLFPVYGLEICETNIKRVLKF
jgi:hypothetical protein